MLADSVQNKDHIALTFCSYERENETFNERGMWQRDGCERDVAEGWMWQTDGCVRSVVGLLVASPR